jgi:hypothetical protein
VFAFGHHVEWMPMATTFDRVGRCATRTPGAFGQIVVQTSANYLATLDPAVRTGGGRSFPWLQEPGSPMATATDDPPLTRPPPQRS